MNVTLDEFRVAINQLHHCQPGRVAEVVQVTVAVEGEAPWQGAVHVFEISGHAAATRCFAWPSQPDPATVIIHAVLQRPATRSAEQAVRSILRRAARKARSR